MARAHTRRRSGVFTDLPPAYAGPVPTKQQTAEILGTFWRDPTEATRNAAVTAFLPLAPRVVVRLLSRWRGANLPSPDEMISDAVLALIDVVQRSLGGAPNAEGFVSYTFRAMVMRIWRERRSRAWGGFVSERGTVLRRLRIAFVRAHGRLPTAAELRDQTASLIDNPNIQVGEPPRVESADEVESLALTPDPIDPPDLPAIDRETIRLAMKGLAPDDKRIMAAALDGADCRTVGAMLGVSHECARQRMNAVLWQARASADLAAYLGVEPTPLPQESQVQRWPQVKKLPPARRVG